MRLLSLGLLWLVGAWGQITSVPTVPPPNVPTWQKYAVVAIANTVNGCANANGCWQVNGVLGANKAAGLTQAITLFAAPAKAYEHAYQAETVVACTGTTTLKITEVHSDADPDYDLKAAVSNTNYVYAVKPLSNTKAAENFTVGLTSTVENIDQVAAGCAFTVYVLWAVLP